MARLLVIHHTASPALDTMLEAVLDGAGNDQIQGVEVVARAALSATVTDVLHADGYILGTPANLGYMSGGLKHFFDTIYYPCLHDTGRRPYGLYVHGNSDVDGAVVSVERIVKGLRWAQIVEPLRCIGAVGPADRETCWELGAVVAATLAELNR